MLSYNQAEQQMANLLKKADDYYQEHISDKEPNQEELTEHQFLIDEAHNYGEYLASYPHFFEILEGWMVDIHGQGEMIDLTEYPTDFIKFIEEHGSLAQSIQSFITKHNFNITDRGGGIGIWQVGVPCTTSDMRKLTALVHAKFSRAIEKGVISIHVRFWHWRLPTLRNMEDVRKFTKE